MFAKFSRFCCNQSLKLYGKHNISWIKHARDCSAIDFFLEPHARSVLQLFYFIFWFVPVCVPVRARAQGDQVNKGAVT